MKKRASLNSAKFDSSGSIKYNRSFIAIIELLFAPSDIES
jgi:hypothetical protein